MSYKLPVDKENSQKFLIWIQIHFIEQKVFMPIYGTATSHAWDRRTGGHQVSGWALLVLVKKSGNLTISLPKQNPKSVKFCFNFIPSSESKV